MTSNLNFASHLKICEDIELGYNFNLLFNEIIFFEFKLKLVNFMSRVIGRPAISLNSSFGKFLSISLCWTFSFHMLNEIRHLIWDAGYGFDPKISKITGYVTLILSFLLATIIYVIGVNL